MDRNERYLTTAWRIMTEIDRADQLEIVLSKGVEILCKAMKCESGSIWMNDDKDKRIHAVVSHGPDNIVGLSVEQGVEIMGWVASMGDSMIFNDVKNEWEVQVPDVQDVYGQRVLCVPLKTPTNLMGCILFTGKEEDFDQEDAKLCENSAALLALDIEDKGFTYHPDENVQPLISMRGIIKEFPSGEEMRRILKGIDLDIYEGELLVILGESGCGKSTLLNIVGGMDSMTEGTLMVEGSDFSHPSESELTEYRRDYIGFIFQSYNLMPNLTALENIEFIAEVSQNPMNSMETLNMVGLGEKYDRFPSAMSGGQQQRVCIARAFVKNPKIILADEPTAALDSQTGQDVLKVIEKIVKEHKTTVIMVTHNVEIAKMANRVIKLQNGRISSIRVNMRPMKAVDITW